MIKDADLFRIQKIHDGDGAELRMLGVNDPFFTTFGEIFFTYVKPAKIKAWEKIDVDAFVAVPSGTAVFVLYDDRPESVTRNKHRTFVIGISGQYNLLKIPAGVWYGFKSISDIRGVLAAFVISKPLDEVTHISIRHDSLFDKFGKPVHVWR
jgi:dTDP-4-dehydrorhamnose 3,5-epimerase